MAKAGLYSFSSADASNAGLTLGITRRKREHTKVEYDGYSYDTHYDKQMYFDLIFTPIANLPEPRTTANGQEVPLGNASIIGGRIGYQNILYGTTKHSCGRYDPT